MSVVPSNTKKPAWNHWELSLRKFERSQEKFCIIFEPSIFSAFHDRKIISQPQVAPNT